MKTTPVLLLAMALLVSGCAEPMSNTQKGAIIGTLAGAATGAAVGQAAGKDTKSTLIGAGVGAAVGAGAGAGIGYYMDRQEAKLRETLANVEGVNVVRDGNNLNVSFRSDNQFKVGSASLQPGAQGDLQRFADVIREFDKTNVTVVGHTDSTGSESANQKLSEQRAAAVRDLAVARGVAAGRLTTVGLGESRPVSDNGTDYGRQLNRRVEIVIVPQEK